MRQLGLIYLPTSVVHRWFHIHRSIAALLALLFMGYAISGCLQRDGDKEETTDETGTSGTTTTPTNTAATTTNRTRPTGTGANHPPSASLTAESENRALDVNFTIRVLDRDGDDISWTLDADGDASTDESGRTNNATYTHTYESNGTYNATLDATDGELTTSVNVTVTVGGTGGGNESIQSLQRVEGSYDLGGPVECLFGFLDDFENLTFVKFTVDNATRELGFNATFDFAVPGIAAVDFYDVEDEYIETHGGLLDPGNYGDSVVSGIVHEDAVTGYLYSCGGAAVDVVYEVAWPA